MMIVVVRGCIEYFVGDIDVEVDVEKERGWGDLRHLSLRECRRVYLLVQEHARCVCTTVCLTAGYTIVVAKQGFFRWC